MIKIKTIRQDLEITLIDDILCNRCEASLKRQFPVSDFEGVPTTYRTSQIAPLSPPHNHSSSPALQDRRADFYGLVEAKVFGGYLSDHLEDNTGYSFSLCAVCLADFFDSFKTPPEVTSDLSRWASPERREAEVARMAEMDAEFEERRAKRRENVAAKQARKPS